MPEPERHHGASCAFPKADPNAARTQGQGSSLRYGLPPRLPRLNNVLNKALKVVVE